MSSKIEKKDLKTIYRRYLALNCMNDYPGQMHNGYTFSLLPVLDKIIKKNVSRPRSAIWNTLILLRILQDLP